MTRVKIRGYRVVKLILTGFVFVQENIKPSVLKVQTELYSTKPVSMRIIQPKALKVRTELEDSNHCKFQPVHDLEIWWRDSLKNDKWRPCENKPDLERGFKCKIAVNLPSAPFKPVSSKKANRVLHYLRKDLIPMSPRFEDWWWKKL